MSSTAISAQGCLFKISTDTGSAVVPTAIALGNPTILTKSAHGLSNGGVVALSGFTGADAALLNGVNAVVVDATTNTWAVDIDTTGKTVTVSGSPAATPVAYTQIKNLKTFTGLDGQVSDIDITNMDSVAKEYRPGLIDNGMFSGEIDRDTTDAGQLAMDAARVAAATHTFTLTLPNAAVASFSGYVKKFPLAGGVDQVLKTAFEVKITGAVTWA